MSALRRAGLALGLTLALLGLSVASASAEPILDVDLSRDSAPTSTPLTHSDERAVYKVTVKNMANANPSVGDQLTCENSTSSWFNVARESDFVYQWLRNGAEIPGASAKTYLTTAADGAQAIQCRVIGTNPSTAVTVVNATATVTAGSDTLTAVNVKFGSFTVGQEVRGFGIPAGTTIVAIGSGTLELSAAATDSVTGTLLGLAPSKVSTSAASVSLPPVVVNPLPATLPPAPVGDPKQVESRPQVVSVPGGFGGYFYEGETLSCKAPTNWTPAATFAYQWLRNGEQIAGATSSEYTPVEAEDKEAVLQCEVTAQTGSGVPPAGGRAVSTSGNVGWQVKNSSNAESFPVVDAAPNDARAGREGRPAIGFANTLTGATVGIELPAGLETSAVVVRTVGAPKWDCTKQAPTALQHARVDCINEDSRAPGETYRPLEIITHIGHDAPDALVAKATASAPGAVSVSDEDEVTVGPAVPFGFKFFSTKVADFLGNDFTKAGGHPFSAGAKLEFNDHVPALPGNMGLRAVNGFVKEVVTKLPQGFIGNPRAVAKNCPEVADVTNGTCPAASLIGGVTVETEFSTYANLPLYSIQPEHGSVAVFAFGFQGPKLAYVITPRLHAADGYAISAATAPIAKSPELFGAEATLCGFGAKLQKTPDEFKGCRKAGDPGSSPIPFLTNPTRCSGPPPTTTIAANSWEHPETYAEATSANPPLDPASCEEVVFEPETSLVPTSKQADSATGLDVEISMPTEGLLDPNGTAQANLADSVVTLPKGMAVNPTAAEGLGACTSIQIGLGNDEEPSCPPSSKVGTVEVVTPLLEEPLNGSVYVAKQGDNPFGSLLALYLVLESDRYGLLIKVPGKVTPDPVTGQLVTSFTDIPEAPVESVSLHLNSGERAPLLNPPKCGTYAIRAELSPWNDGPTVLQDSRFKVSKGPNGGPCPTGNLEPKLSGRLANPTAGATSPFTLQLTRADGTQRFNGLELTMPPGLTGYLKGIPYCPDAALAAISGAEGTGSAQIASPSCPAASQLGGALVGAGAGTNPFYVDTPKVYLAGPYKNAPLSIAVVSPAVAGPFDLGSVVVRNAAYVNPETAQITLKSDPIPTILHGIPLDIREIRVNVDRPHFILAPTNCEPSSINAKVSGEEGASANASDRFQVGGCERLGFKPKLALKLKGGTKRGAHPRLTATLKARAGDANIAKASVALPHSAFLDTTHIKTICTRVQFAAKQCPKAAIYGYAEATTPLLDHPVKGPVYLRSSSNPLPDLVAALRGPDNQPIEVALAGRIDSVNGGIRSSFDAVPDQPVSSFTLSMQGGKKGLLINSRDICRSKAKVTADFTAQNGAEANLRPVLRNDCGKARKGKKAKRTGNKQGGKK